jgi:hypothetical protein
MANFPVVQFIDGGRTAQGAGANAAPAFMSAILAGGFTQGVPPDLAKLSIGTGASVITLGASPAYGLYIANKSATASVQVTATPNGGSSAVIGVIAPGGFLMVANPSAGSAPVTATPGYTAVTLQATAAATPVEFALIG